MKKVIVFGFENVLFNVSDIEKRKKKSEVVVETLKMMEGKEELLDVSMGRKKGKKVEKNEEMMKEGWTKKEKWRASMMKFDVDELRERLIELERNKMEVYKKGSGLNLRTYGGVKEEMEKLRSLRKSVAGFKVYVVSDMERDLVKKALVNNGIEVDGVKGRLESVIEDCGMKEEMVVFYGDEKGMERCEELGVKGVRCKWNGKMDDEMDGMNDIGELWGEIGLRRA